MQVREIAASTAGNEDFFAGARGAFKDRNASPSLPCFDGAHQACGTGAENYGIIVVTHLRFGERRPSADRAPAR